MRDEPNPLGRKYTASEWAAARRVGIEVGTFSKRGGPLLYATGDFYPDEARQKANDWKIVADAMEREFYSPKESE